MYPAKILPRILRSQWWPCRSSSAQWNERRSQLVDIEKGTDSADMFVSSLPLIADFTLSPFYLPGRQFGGLEVQQPPFNHEDKSQVLSVVEEK